MLFTTILTTRQTVSYPPDSDLAFTFCRKIS